jgi:hypothetical protein
MRAIIAIEALNYAPPFPSQRREEAFLAVTSQGMVHFAFSRE